MKEGKEREKGKGRKKNTSSFDDRVRESKLGVNGLSRKIGSQKRSVSGGEETSRLKEEPFFRRLFRRSHGELSQKQA